MTPYYNKPNRAGIMAHYEAVAKAAGVPVLLYNIPSRVVVNVPPDLLAELAQIENVVGVKQANDDELQPIDGLARPRRQRRHLPAHPRDGGAGRHPGRVPPGRAAR